MLSLPYNFPTFPVISLFIKRIEITEWEGELNRVSSLGRAVVEEEPEEEPGDERIAGEDKPALRETDPIDHKARRIGSDRGAEPIRHHQEDALSRGA